MQTGEGRTRKVTAKMILSQVDYSSELVDGKYSLLLDFGQSEVEDFSVVIKVDTDGTPSIAEDSIKSESFQFSEVTEASSSQFVAQFQQKQWKLNQLIGFFISAKDSKEQVLMEKNGEDIFFCINYPVSPDFSSVVMTSTPSRIAIAWVKFSSSFSEV